MYLVELAFDRRQAVGQRPRGRSHVPGVGRRSEPVVELGLDVADRDDRGGCRIDGVAQPLQERELLAQLRRCDFGAGIDFEREALRVRPAAHVQADLIRPRQRHGPVRPHADHSPEGGGVWVFHVPHEHVQAHLVGRAGQRRRTLRPGLVGVLERVGDDAVDLHAVRHARLLEAVRPGALHAVAADAVRGGERVRPAREAADDVTGGVEDIECDPLVLVLQPVIDHRPVGWVLPHRMRLVRREREAPRPVDAVGVARLEEMRGFARRRPHQLAQRRDVVQDPERAPVGRRDEVAVLDHEVVHRDDRQVAAQRLPVGAIVERHPHPVLGAREQEAAPYRVFPHDAHELRRGDPAHRLPPRLAVVAGPVDVGRPVLELVAVGRQVGGARREA